MLDNGNPYGWPQTRIDLFIERHNAGLSREALAREFTIGSSKVSALRQCLKLEPAPLVKRPAPPNLREVIDEFGVGVARRRFNAGWDTMSRWAKETNMEIAGGPNLLLEVPEGFEEYAPHNFKKQIGAHFNLSSYKVTVLLEQTNITPRRFTGSVTTPPSSTRNHQMGGDYFTPAPVPVAVDLASRAAHYLRRVYSNVHRCDLRLYENGAATWGVKHGVPNSGRGYYHVDGIGNILNVDLIALARKKGFTE